MNFIIARPSVGSWEAGQRRTSKQRREEGGRDRGAAAGTGRRGECAGVLVYGWPWERAGG